MNPDTDIPFPDENHLFRDEKITEYFGQCQEAFEYFDESLEWIINDPRVYFLKKTMCISGGLQEKPSAV